MRRMDQQGNGLSVNAYTSLLKACTKRKALAQAKRVHAQIGKYVLESNRFLGEYVVSTLVKCGDLEGALEVFSRLPCRTVSSWTAMISGYTCAGRSLEALRMYQHMHEEGLEPNRYTFVSLLKACASLSDLKEGRRIHAEALKYGCATDLFVGARLVEMYAKCGSIVEAHNVFNGLSERDVVSWTVLLTAYAQLGQAANALQLYEQMHEEGVTPNNWTIVGALQACGRLAEKEEEVLVNGQWTKSRSLEQGKALHANALRKGYESHIFVGSTLVSMYGKCGSIMDAQNVFAGLSQQIVVAWNAMMAAYTQQAQEQKALQLYEQMLEQGVSPDNWTFVSVLQACSLLAEKEKGLTLDRMTMKVKSYGMGREIHANAWRKGYKSDHFVGNILISLYGKCGSILGSENVFGGLSQRTVVSWNAIIAGYVEHGQEEKAFQLYRQMQEEGVSPEVRTFVSALQACGVLAEKEEGVVVDGRSTKVKSVAVVKAIHADARLKGCDSNVFVGSTLVTMYGKCGTIVDAQNMFDQLPQHSVVAWTAMLAACVEQGNIEAALQLYSQMQDQGVSPNEVTQLCMLQACCNSGSLQVCKKLHHTLVSTGTELGLVVANTLIHAYGCCASMVDAQTVFDALPQRNVVSWTALLAGYARQGNYAASVKCYDDMRQAGVIPDGATFLSLLSVCSHAGLVDRGVEYFESMSRDYNLPPGIEHYATMVDLLGRAGYLKNVADLLLAMPTQPDMAMWLCLLSACRKHGNLIMAKQAFEGAVALQPKHAAPYVLMANMYADASLGDYTRMVNELRQKAGAWKMPGRSWINHEQRVYAFLVGDFSSSCEEELYKFLRELTFISAHGE